LPRHPGRVGASKLEAPQCRLFDNSVIAITSARRMTG
jgi:hypothetical protein